MTDQAANERHLRRPALAAALLAAGLGLSGCAGMGDGFASGAFVDPAKYDLYDCKQLEAERKSLASQTASQQKLIDKANTGAAGSVVGEMVYRDDYIKIRASAKLADEAWHKSKCDAPAAPAAGTVPPKTAQGASAPRHSGGAIY